MEGLCNALSGLSRYTPEATRWKHVYEWVIRNECRANDKGKRGMQGGMFQHCIKKLCGIIIEGM